MTKRAFISFLVTIKVLTVAAVAAITMDPSLQADHSDWMDGTCAPWEDPCTNDQPGS